MRSGVAKRRSIVAILGSAILATVSQPLASQTVTAPQMDGATIRTRLAPAMAPAGRPMPADVAELDTMLRQKDFARLVARLRGVRSAQEAGLDLNWEQTRLYDGAGFLIALSYMQNLWRLGAAMPDDSGEGLKGSAGMMFLYAVDLVALDGTRCADASAPGHRRDQLFAQSLPIIAYLRALPRAARMTSATVSLNIEAATAPLRADDDILCSGGLAEITTGLKAQGAKPLEQTPNAPGTIGKTYSVPPAPGYEPQFVAADVWRPKQAAARHALPASLTRLLTVPGDAQSQPPAK